MNSPGQISASSIASSIAFSIMVYRSRQRLFIAGLVCFGIGSSVAMPNFRTNIQPDTQPDLQPEWQVDGDRASSLTVAALLQTDLQAHEWLTSSTVKILAQSSPSSSPSASLSSPSSPAFKDWMWWAVLVLIPLGILAGVLYGLQRASRKTKLSPKEHKKSNVSERDRRSPTVPRSITNYSPDPDSGLDESEHHANHANLESPPLSLTENSPLANTTRLAKVDIVEELIRDLHSLDPSKRRKAIWELGQRGDSRAVQPLVDLLVDSDSTQRSLILATISEIGVRTLKPMNRALMMSIQDDSADVRKNAIRDVTRIFDLVSQMSQLLQYAASDPDGEVQQTAEWALAQLNRIRSLPGTEGLPSLTQTTQTRLPSLTDDNGETQEHGEDKS